MLPDLDAEAALDVPIGMAGGAAFWPSDCLRATGGDLPYLAQK
jgi:hypothetical protein